MLASRTFECFGLVIHGFGWEQTVARIEDTVEHGRPLWIVTTNPEILLTAKKNPHYWQSLRQADLRLVDGAGLQLIGWLFQSSPRRFAGVDCADHLLRLAEEKDWKVSLVGGDSEVADKAAWNVRKKYPRLRITAEHGGTINATGEGDEASEEALHRLSLEGPEILLLAFGHPKQESWIARHLGDLPSVKVIMGVGGTFDYWAETKKRAPSWLRFLGLEWLWRLIQEPKRWKRIIDAVLIFPAAAIREKVFRER